MSNITSLQMLMHYNAWAYVADILYQMDLQPPSMDLSVFLNRSAPR